MVLENYRHDYEYAYDYIAKTNRPSIAASERCGFKPYLELDVIGITRKPVVVDTNGRYIAYRYEHART